MENHSQLPPFLALNTEIARLMRERDWSDCTLGAPATWPGSLGSKLNTIMSSAFPMVLFWGEELTCFYNDAFRPSLGTDGKHPAIGKKGKEVWSEAWDFMGPLIDNVMSGGKPVWFEDKPVPIYRNGKIEDIYWTSSYSAIMNDEGKINGVVVICTETTDKVNLLKKLEESKNLYSFAVDASELGTWDLDPVTNKFLANDRLKDWFGLSPEKEIELELAISVIAEKDRERVGKGIQHALDWRSGGNYDIEYTIIHPHTKQERIVKAKGKAAFNEQQQPYRFNGTLQDITTEVLAREQNQKLSVLVENSVDLMAILKMDGKNSYINKAGKELLGINEDADVTQIPIADFHTPEQLAFVESQILPGVMSAGIWEGEFAIKNGKTGEIIPLYNNCHRIDDERTGEPIGVGTVMRDIRKEVHARQILEDEVKKRTKELLKLNEQLEQKNKELSSFAFVSSHDLQEPLRKINTFISRIEEENNLLTKEHAGYFEKIKSSAVRMQTLIGDLLSYSRTSTADIVFEETDLNVILNDVKAEFQYKLEEMNASVESNTLAVLRIIPFQLRQLFSNLLANSLKFQFPGKTPVIKVHGEWISDNIPEMIEGDHCYCISFADNGIGFEPHYTEKIFEVFQRLHGRNVYEGTGIGLSICKKIMENHGGTITADGKPGEGAVFRLYFPG